MAFEAVQTPSAPQAGDAAIVERGGNPAMVDITIIPGNAQTGATYTLALTDAAHFVTMDNGSANTLTIPTNTAIAFPVGTVITVGQKGAGTTTIDADTGVTLNGVSGGQGDISAQWATVMLRKVATDTWEAWGSIGTVA